MNKSNKKIDKQIIQKLINYYQSNNLKKLEKAIKKLFTKFPNEIFLYNMLGISLIRQKKFKEGIAVFKNALKKHPDNPEITCNIGNALYAKGDLTKAKKKYEQSIKIKPSYSEAYYNLANIFKDQSKFKDAMFNYQKAIKINKNYAEAYCNLGNIKKYQGNLSGAAINYKKALKINPKYNAAYINLAYLNLSLEKFKDGWEGHEKRNEIEILFKELKLNKNNLWNGKKFEGILMVIGEQGLGDYILFGSMLNDLIKIQKEIIVKINSRLLSLFKRSFPKIKFIKFDSPINNNDYTKYIFFGSLGKYFRKSSKSFPKNQISFLFPDKNKILKIKKLLNDKSKVKIGLSWRTNSLNNKRERSINLIDFQTFFNNTNYDFVNLQYGDTKDERNLLYKKFGINLLHFNNIDYTNDIESLAALIKECDLVITIANFTAQLSGSLGTPTLVLLPYSCHWRWFVNRSDSLWYPSVKIFRQKKWGDWSNVIKKVSNNIKHLQK